MDATITITMTADGRINVTGAITNKVMAYGLLEAAKDAIRDFHAKQAEAGGLQLVHGTLPGVN